MSHEKVQDKLQKITLLCRVDPYFSAISKESTHSKPGIISRAINSKTLAISNEGSKSDIIKFSLILHRKYRYDCFDFVSGAGTSLSEIFLGKSLNIVQELQQGKSLALILFGPSGNIFYIKNRIIKN